MRIRHTGLGIAAVGLLAACDGLFGVEPHSLEEGDASSLDSGSSLSDGAVMDGATSDGSLGGHDGGVSDGGSDGPFTAGHDGATSDATLSGGPDAATDGTPSRDGSPADAGQVDATVPSDGGYDAANGGDATAPRVDSGFDGGYDSGYDGGDDAGFDAGHDAGYDSGYDACVPVTTGSALSFGNASGSQFVTIADSTVLHLTKGMTIEAWVKTASSSGCIVCKPVGSATEDSFATWVANGDLSWGMPSNAQPYFGTAWSWDATSWHHVAATFDGMSQSLQLYVDGALANSSTNTQGVAPFDGNPLLIGTDRNNGAFDVGFQGVIDDVRIYSTARSASQIAADRADLCSPMSDPTLVVYYPFNEGSGGTVHDATQNHLDGTLSSAAAGPPSWVTSTFPF